MIIDMRLRPPLPSWKSTPQFDERAGYYPTRLGFPRPRSVGTQSIADLLDEMDEAGIGVGVIMGRQSAPPLGLIPNDEIAAVIRDHPRRFVGFAGIDLARIESGLAEIDRTARLPGFCGVSIEPGAAREAMYSDDQRLYPIYDCCVQLGLPISISLSGALAGMVGNDLAYGSPTSVHQVARDFPRLRIIVSHAAWPHVMPMLEVAFLHQNVYVSPDLYMNHIDMPGAHEFIKATRMFLSDRMLFGTAYPSRPLKESVSAFRQWNLSPELEQMVLHSNAAKLLRLNVGAPLATP